MTENETVKIIAMLYMAYPAVNKLSMAKLMRSDLIPPDIAWSTINDYIHTRDCYVQLPPLIAKAVDTIGTYTLKECRDGYDKQMFMDLYKPAYERELEKAMLPKALGARIAKSDEAFGGEDLKAIAKVSEAREKERKMYEEAFKSRYERFEALPQD